VKNALYKQNDPESIELTVPAFGYELIRQDVLTEVLGKDSSQLLYWAGKSLARKYPLETTDEIINFFSQAGWGTLSIESTNKKEMEIHLTGDLISLRLQNLKELSFQLEAGFLAQQFQQQRNQLTEAYEQQKKRALKVIFTIKSDN